MTKIKLNGFKSFVEPTEIPIRNGLTGIVGPNGCGKSNILSAIEWVMGKNVSVPRRSSAIEDIIFSGSSSRPARNFAEVMIEVESAGNASLLTPRGDKSFNIVRRATRDIGSAYKVNGEDVSASVVRKFFSDVSIDVQSSALVRQGQVSELVNASPRSRSRILLEAAGVSGFHQRKHEAELKLRGAETNLSRVADVIGQLSSQLTTLNHQARASERYRQINEEMRLSQRWLLEKRLGNAELVRSQFKELTERIVRQLGDHQKLIANIESPVDQSSGGRETLSPKEELGVTISQVEEWSKKASEVLESAEETLRDAMQSDLPRGRRSAADTSEMRRTSVPNSAENSESFGNPEYFEQIRDKSVHELEQAIVQLETQRNALGAVNLRAKDDAKEVQSEFDQLSGEKDDLERAIQTLRQGIASLETGSRERLLDSFENVNYNFNLLFRHLFVGGEARLILVESDDPLEAGLEIMCQVPGKKLSTLSLLSGGEQSLIALALVFAVVLSNPTPICVLDEVDAALDGPNVERFCDLLDEMAERVDTKFVVITHNSATMARMDRLYGVTMPERGVGQLVSLELAVAKELVA
ncbi:AAA family ATPase [Ruegeria sp. 2205SS24-7]|nr:AAA family ATPase [Ruegeria sp. 2205SS24-7]MDP5220395.1 AAA family ATPase [Ruegeria sp. 2205SS24-7]